jgi:glycosyltransferase involved in cell wall biosynthesis
MNILILNWRDVKNPKSGGAEIVTMEHAKAWVRAGNKVVWFTSFFEGARETEKIDNVEIVRKGNFITVYLLGALFYLLSKRKYDLVIDEIHGVPFFTPLYVRKPKIAYIHEVADKIWDYMFPFPLNHIGKLIEPLYFWLYRDVKFLVPSTSTTKDLEKFGIKKKNCTIVLGAIQNKTLDALPIKEKAPTFIFVSRVVKMKGVEEVIKSFFHILRVLKNANLWIVGDGDKKYIDYLKKTMNLYAISSKIKFLGRVSEAKKMYYMRRAHLLLHASVKEGWGLVVIEAASLATPSVVYNVAGLRDSVLKNKTGIILKSNTPTEMAKAAVELYKDKIRYVNYQRTCLQWAKSITWEKETAKSLQLIESVAFRN